MQTIEFVIVQSLNGLSYAALLFLLASGLTIIFGLMNVLNLAHGSFFMVGAYVGVSVAQLTSVMSESSETICAPEFPPPTTTTRRPARRSPSKYGCITLQGHFPDRSTTARSL